MDGSRRHLCILWQSDPLLSLIELFRRYLQIREGESDEAIRTKVQDYLVNLDRRLTDAIPPVLALLGALPDYGKTDRQILLWQGAKT